MEKTIRFLMQFENSAKVISQTLDGKIQTVKNITPEKYMELIEQHLLGKIRLGVAPEIKDSENVLFGCIDIDCKDLSIQEKYNIALELKEFLQKEYRLDPKVEKSKSKGFHVWVFFDKPLDRNFIKNILENAIEKSTDKKIANGEIEVFPKGDKGNGIFLPFFGMFKEDKSINEEFFKEKKACLVKDSRMNAIEYPIELIKQSINNNTFTLNFLSKLKQYPQCIEKAALNWTIGERNTLALALAGVLKKISKISEEEAIEIIKEIALFNNDEEVDMRINAVISTYKSDEVAGCSIMQGKNSNIALTNTLCDENCESIAKFFTVKDKVRALQIEYKRGVILKESVAALIKSVIKESGKIYKSNCRYYLFLKDEKHLITLTDDSREFKNLLTKWGINASETLFKYVKEELYVHCAEHAMDVDIHRFAYFDKKNYVLYIYNASNLILKITENSVITIENGDDGILFEELNDYTPFKLVRFDENKNYLSEYLIKNLNLESDEYNINIFKLAEIWFYSLFFESIMPTKPIFVLIGEKGSGKTSFLRRSGQILMGEKFDVTSISSDYKNLTTLITNNYFIVIDNLDSPTTQINDTLARIATGQVIKTRDLYTTNKQVDFTAKCFVALTSRKPHFTRDDVSDRLICIFIKRFKSFESENKLKANVSKKRDEIMSYVISRLQIILRNLKNNKDKTFKTKFRMADFAEFAFKIISNDEEIKSIEEMLVALTKQQKDFAIRDDIVYIILTNFVSKKYNLDKFFTSGDLFTEFQNEASLIKQERYFNNLYSNPRALTTHLKNISANFADEVQITRRKATHGNGYLYAFSLVDKNKSLSETQAIEKLMNRDIETQINAYNEYVNKGGKDE